ncbi:MAG: Mrp/NBP35 family ATP-binding protein [bacterium]|nr:Mrp/NBP35 family ATP-binding protein [bacterium]
MPRQEDVKAKVLETLKKVNYPGYNRNIVSFGMAKGLRVEGDKLTVNLAMKGVDAVIADQIKQEAIRLLKAESGFQTVEVTVENEPPPQPGSAHESEGSHQAFNPKPLAGIKYVVAVSSGKGGVGKSTVAVNLACAAAQRGLKVGILDSDIHGPSLPTLLGINSQPETEDEGFIPIEKYGLKAMSIGFLIESGQPLIWRGPMVNKALEQLYHSTLWGELDVLFVDLPPGTGDVQITLAQNYKISGAIIVTTPQNLALEDVRRGVVMFQHTAVHVLGIVENMSFYRCPDCKSITHPFGEGGGEREAADLQVPFLGRIPLDTKTRELSDKGIPVVVDDPQSESAQCYFKVWDQTYQRLTKLSES